MSKDIFYNSLIYTETPLETVFESYPNDDYSELVEYLLERVQTNYSFPNDNPEVSKDKPLIPVQARYRLGVVCRTLDAGASYTKERLELAKEFMAKKNSEVLEG